LTHKRHTKELQAQQSTLAPLITIVVPVHGEYHRYLAECLTSLVAQTYENWEAVVVDDGSAHDLIENIVKRFADGRMRYVRHERNRGLAAARNTGIRNGTGRFILPLDADDRLDSECLSKLVGAIQQRDGIQAAFPNLYAFDAVNTVLTFEVRDTRALLEEQWIPGAGTLYRRELWDAAGGYCEADALRAGNEDWDFWLSVARNDVQAAHVPEPLYFYRQHYASMVKKLQSSEHFTREFMYGRHKQLFDSHGMGHLFLGEGYRRAARYAAMNNHWLKAFPLALRALWLAPGNLVRQEFASLLRVVRRTSLESAIPKRQ
jgi:glycosyltransferase involved in cell wall biosynthesis